MRYIDQKVQFCDECHELFGTHEARVYDPKTYDTLHIDCAYKRQKQTDIKRG